MSKKNIPVWEKYLQCLESGVSAGGINLKIMKNMVLWGSKTHEDLCLS